MIDDDENLNTLNNVGRAFREIQKWLIGKKINKIEKINGKIWRAELTDSNGVREVLLWKTNLDYKEKIYFEIEKSSYEYIKKINGNENKISDNKIEVGIVPVLLYNENNIK